MKPLIEQSSCVNTPFHTTENIVQKITYSTIIIISYSEMSIGLDGLIQKIDVHLCSNFQSNRHGNNQQTILQACKCSDWEVVFLLLSIPPVLVSFFGRWYLAASRMKTCQGSMHSESCGLFTMVGETFMFSLFLIVFGRIWRVTVDLLTNWVANVLIFDMRSSTP